MRYIASYYLAPRLRRLAWKKKNRIVNVMSYVIAFSEMVRILLLLRGRILIS